MYYGSNNQEDGVYVYIEKYIKAVGIVLFDFVDSNDFLSFNTPLRSNENQDSPTMIELLNYHQRPVQEGGFYHITRKTIDSLLQQIQIVEDSLVVGFRVMIKSDDEIFDRTKRLTETDKNLRNIYDNTNTDKFSQLQLETIQFDKVIIRKVGQGNWNELVSSNRFALVFDIGTIYTTKASAMAALIGNRDAEYQKSKPMIVLSHWDVDHYHFLLYLSDSAIRSITTFIYRGIIPGRTARRVLDRFRRLNPNALVSVPALDPHPKRSSTVLSKSNLSSSILIFNSYYNKSRNKCALGLVLRKSRVNVVFSGDYDYRQISDYILPHLNYKSEHYLIVPHHGGRAGKVVYKYSKLLKLMTAIVSVGKNPYRPSHPYVGNISSLRTLGFVVIRTDIYGADFQINV